MATISPNNDTIRKEDLFRLAEIAFNSFNTRRQYEWKILLALWAVLLFTMNDSWTLPRLPFCVWTAIYLAIGIGATFWVMFIWSANRDDKQKYEYYLRLLGMLTVTWNNNMALGFPLNAPGAFPQQNHSRRLDANAYLQIVVTWILVLIALFANASKSVPTPDLIVYIFGVVGGMIVGPLILGVLPSAAATDQSQSATNR